MFPLPTVSDNRLNRNDFERRMALLLDALETTQLTWASSPEPRTYPDAMAAMAAFSEYKRTSKRIWVRERQELAALYSNIQTKLKTYVLAPWEPVEGLRLEVSVCHCSEVFPAQEADRAGSGEAVGGVPYSGRSEESGYQCEDKRVRLSLEREEWE